MGYPWKTHGQPMAYKEATYRLSMGYLRDTHETLMG